jgi:hypothetical protein
VADISEYLRRQEAKGPKRKKRDGEARTLWNSPTAAAQDEAASLPRVPEKIQEKQLSPNNKTSSTKTPNNKTSIQKASSKPKLDRKAKASSQESASQGELLSKVLETAATESADESLEVISVAAATQIALQQGNLTVSSLEPLQAVIEGAAPAHSVVSEDKGSDDPVSEVVDPAPRIFGASLADDHCDDFKAVALGESAILIHKDSTVDDGRGFSGIDSPAILSEIPLLVKDPTLFLAPVGDILGRSANEAVDIRPPEHPQSVLASPVARPRSRPVTVGKASSLPPAPSFADLSKDEWFLAKYWLSPGPGGVPRSQERFFHFYRFLYNEAAKTGSARVYCTEEMAVETLGPKARGTFTNYRKLGQRYGMFTVHIVGNLGRREDCLPGTYFFLLFPWINQ